MYKNSKRKEKIMGKEIKKNKNKLKGNKGEWVVRIMAGFLAVLMLGATFSSLIYYIID